MSQVADSLNLQSRQIENNMQKQHYLIKLVVFL